MNAGAWIGTAVATLALLEGLRRTLRRPVKSVLHFFRELRNAVYDIRGYDTRNPRTGETKRTPGMAERLETVEGQLRPNGGNSARDVLDKVHGIAQDNRESNARLEKKAQEAVITAGEAAAAASIAKQQLDELRAENRERHAENLRRFRELEGNDEAAQISREFFLRVLKNDYDIDLLPDEDPPPPLHLA